MSIFRLTAQFLVANLWPFEILNFRPLGRVMTSMVILDSIRQDVAFAVRTFGRARLLTASILATLMLGIGVNAAVFSVVNGLIFRARTSLDPSHFLQLQIAASNPRPGETETWKASMPLFERLKAARTVKPLEAWAVVHSTMGDNPDDQLVMLVTCGFFSLYGAPRATLGRILEPADCQSQSDPVAVMSAELWKRAFHSDPAIVGSTLNFNRRPFRIVGIAPSGFEGRLRGPGIWIPSVQNAAFFSGQDQSDSISRWLIVEGRLAPGISRSVALVEITTLVGPGYVPTLTDGSLVQHPSSGPIVHWVVPLLMSAFGLVLMLACINVTVMLLARAASREKEIAIRLSVGAGRGRLLRMLLTEGVTVSLLAGALSAWICLAVPTLFDRIMWRAPHYIVTPDWAVFGYLALITLFAGSITGLAPAKASLDSDLNTGLKGTPRNRTRDLLIAVQISSSLVLLVGATLFVRAESALLAAGTTDESQHTLLIPWRGAIPEYLELHLSSLANVQSVHRDSSLHVGAPPGTNILALRFKGDSAKITASVTALMESLDPNQTNIPFTLSSQFSEMAGRFSVIESTVAVLGGIALVMAVIGIYGVVNFSVMRRRKELGIRLALGALTRDVVRCVVVPGFEPVVAGVVAGTALALMGSLALQKVFERAPVHLNPFAVAPYLGASSLLVVVALSAMLGPALQAAYSSPAEALRAD